MENELNLESDDFISEPDPNYESAKNEKTNSRKRYSKSQNQSKKIQKIPLIMKPKREGKLEATSLGLIGSSFGYLAIAMASFGMTDEDVKKLSVFMFFPSLLTLIAAILDFRVKHNFGACLFFLVTLFFFSLALSWMMGLWSSSQKAVEAKDKVFASFLIAILVFMIFFTLFALQLTQVQFWFLFWMDIAIFFLILNFGYRFNSILVGIPCLMVSILSSYASLALMYNHEAKREFFPLGQALFDWKKFIVLFRKKN
ncbi:accumulation of dyads protein [Anaeramoeba ignava]|uniref:Accumulation of dyads protein n=1 Tax=Anaeramoeba ignava TaxID=1746090 RepID=A0A9Q0L8R0_ANAIG|nr:accumulation of dyads protein [Anaeramoeba ignava]